MLDFKDVVDDLCSDIDINGWEFIIVNFLEDDDVLFVDVLSLVLCGSYDIIV